MQISYEGLWKLLADKNISKTDFKDTVKISTVTLAKLSKNEHVSLSVIEKICESLHCNISDILTLKSSDKEEKWSRIAHASVYTVRLYYLYDSDSDCEPMFLYGYSIEGDENIPLRNSCQITKSKEYNSIQAWKLEMIISGDNLTHLIRSMEQNVSIKEFLEYCKLKLHSGRTNKKNIESVFSETHIYHQHKQYRPEIILIPGNEGSLFSRGMQPLHSFGHEPLISESLVCGDKKKLYYTADGQFYTDKMELIHDLFKHECFLINGIKDLCRIGDFEVFYPLVKGAAQDELFQIEAKVENGEGLHRILKGFNITIFSKHLSGEYSLLVTTLNAESPTGSKQFDIIIDGHDIERTIELPESSGNAIVQLYDKNSGNRIQLIGYKFVTLWRDMIFTINVQDSVSTLEDSYTRKLSSQSGSNKKAVNNVVERYSSHESHMDDDENDPWRKDFEAVFDDFSQLYGTETAESLFLKGGPSSHEDFLNWLKQKINRSRIKSVWIFDPYIDDKSVPRLARSLSDTGVRLTVVTDAQARSREQKDRIKLLKTACESLKALLPGKLEIYALNGKEALLHDRLIIMFGDKFYPHVYNLSNSLDNMGMNSPSIVCKLNRKDSIKVADYYLNLYTDAMRDKKADTIYQQTNADKSAALRPSGNVQHEEIIQKAIVIFNKKLANAKLPLLSSKGGNIILPKMTEELELQFFDIICDEVPNHWEEIAHLGAGIKYNMSDRLTEYLKDNYKPEWGEALQEKLWNELTDIISPKTKGNFLKVYPSGKFTDILRRTGYMMENSFSCYYDHISWPADLTCRIFIAKDFSRFISLIRQLEDINYSVEAIEIKQKLIKRLVFEITVHKDIAESIATECLKSDLDCLIAVGMQWFIQQGKSKPVIEALNGSEICHEFFKELLIELQVMDCRRSYCADSKRRRDEDYIKSKKQFFQSIQKAKTEWIDFFSENTTSEQLKKLFAGIGTRSNHDVRDLAVMLLRAKKISVAEMEDYLTHCFFEKADEYYKKEDGHLTGESFTDGELFLTTLTRYGTEEGRSALIKKLAANEKKLVNCLHDVFLYNRDYTKWKCYIDMLIWCYTMRILCEKMWSDYTVLVEADKNLYTRQNEIIGLLKKYRQTLEKHSDAYKILTCNFEIIGLDK